MKPTWWRTTGDGARAARLNWQARVLDPRPFIEALELGADAKLRAEQNMRQTSPRAPTIPYSRCAHPGTQKFARMGADNHAPWPARRAKATRPFRTMTFTKAPTATQPVKYHSPPPSKRIRSIYDAGTVFRQRPHRGEVWVWAGTTNHRLHAVTTATTVR